MQACPEVVWFRIQDGFVDELGPLGDFVPIVEVFDAFVCLIWVVFAGGHDPDGFRHGSNDVWSERSKALKTEE